MPEPEIRKPDFPVDLDDTASFRHLDSKGMVKMAQAFPAQCRQGLAIGDQVALPEAWRDGLHSILCVGMGGSAIGGDLLAAVFADRLRYPMGVVRYYDLPRHVDDQTLVIASSHSGDTEEVLTAAREALERGARLVAVTSGGKLAAVCKRGGAPVLIVPGGQPPRASTGYLLMPIVALLGRLGLVGEIEEEREETLRVLEEMSEELGPASPTPDNRAKKLAYALYNRLPILYGSTPMMGPVAFRWRTQINENGKMLAMSHELPELDHNEVVGWEKGPKVLREKAVVVIASPSDPARMQQRLGITQRIIGDKAPIHIEAGRGRSRLAQVVSAMYLGDFMSLYLAFLNEVDPASISTIDLLKATLHDKPLAWQGRAQ